MMMDNFIGTNKPDFGIYYMYIETNHYIYQKKNIFLIKTNKK